MVPDSLFVGPRFEPGHALVHARQMAAVPGPAPEALAAQGYSADVNRLAAPLRVQMVCDSQGASIVADVAASQPRLAPEVRVAPVGHCLPHVLSGQQLAARLASLMRMQAPCLANKKAAILPALIEDYDSSYAPYLVSVCKDVDQLREMHDKMSDRLKGVAFFVENPYAPDSMLLGIASSPGVQAARHDVARRAREMLQLRVDLRESSTYNDVAPS